MKKAQRRSHVHGRADEEGEGLHPVARLQRDAGNRAVTQAIQHSVEAPQGASAGLCAPGLAEIQRKGLFDSARDGLESLFPPKPEAALRSASEAHAELKEVRKWLGQAKNADEMVRGGQAIGQVDEYLGKIQEPLGKALEWTEAGRELAQLSRASRRLRKIDPRADPEAAAEAWSDLCEALGKLGQRPLPEGAGGVAGYLELLQNSGQLFKQGVEWRRASESQETPEKRETHMAEEMSKLAEAAKKRPKAAASDKHKWDELDTAVPALFNKAEQDYVASYPPGQINYGRVDIAHMRSTLAEFTKAFAAFKAQRPASWWARRKDRYGAWTLLWAQAYQALETLESDIGRNPKTQVSFIGCLKALESVKP